ncbi:FIP domain-containing protein [Ditylenchus destructor]|uniref:FIP domain-containing protein n=1 Tax=Ditylenchus destructor TaxID=166010 RepID=A0AAD4RDE3_9BILA|nr:FIP domain-containing protein [Ditylenchus destructor]
MDYLEAEPSSSIGGTLPSSSSSVASRLYMNGTQRSSRRNSFSSEPELMNFSDDGTLGFNDVSSQMSTLTNKLTEMQELQMATNEEKSRLRTENAVLQERVHLLEEQYHSAEKRWTEKLEEEKTRSRELTSRIEREKQLEAESGSLRYQVLEKDLINIRKERDRLEESLREAQHKLNLLRDQLTECQHECERKEVEKEKIKQEYERYRRDAADRMESNSEILEELTRQSDQLRQHGTMAHQGSLTDQIILLEDEIERLRLENRDLREQQMDLQAQILHDSVQCGRNLLADGPPSLAAELSGMDSQGLMNTLREQEIVNQRLKNYVNGILMRIIERHPDILEIKDEELTESMISDTASSKSTSEG